jgi:hypothetical protein
VEDAKENVTPAETKLLEKDVCMHVCMYLTRDVAGTGCMYAHDEGGALSQEPWSYVSVVNMMMYLVSNLRPD